MTRVFISGLGAVTPLANDVPTWEALLAGRSGIDRIQRFDASAFESGIAGEVRNFAPETFLSARDLRHMDRYSQFGVAAALEAIRDAGIEGSVPLGPRAGVVFGAGSCGFN
jgi:3-oxoacyl-[acyl-carrier-protein] synthase II